ncbi:amidohydrolase [Nocardia nova]|uniref:Amidohydrolase n=1 Tax=Nocardia nova TaxID=37330 RepID=A0A2S6AKR1_9NOCA|nr:amidohydrolase family protein [Nocardia nova]PPJ35819.1 amidohydrolase [Nocardia nova]
MSVAAGNAITLNNVRIFDGERVGDPASVTIDGAVIAAVGSGRGSGESIDAAGGVLVPGFIDCHVHLDDPQTMTRLVEHGVTTALDMATAQPDLIAALRDGPLGAGVRSAGLPIIGPAGAHASIPGMAAAAVITDPAQAREMVAQRVAQRSDYIKLILEEPGEGGPDAATAKAVVVAAHAYGLKVIAHTSRAGSYALAVDVGVDILTHVPLAGGLPAAEPARIAAGGHVVVPTLAMMRGVAETFGLGDGFAGALAVVEALHKAGVSVLAGTDANTTPGVPFHPEHGPSLHEELELLVRAGLSTVEALRAATVLPAQHFGLGDRGAIRPGLRADLVLLDGDPVADIRATTSIRRVWCGGVEYQTATA